MEENKNLHKGHRQRLKNKVRTHGLTALSTHEVLELLLTYTIPQKDTNELAHKLINQFGSFASVLDAGYKELLKVNGVGEETALFLSALPKVFEVYKSSKTKTKLPVIKSTENCVSYFRQHFELHSNESLYLICLNKLCHPIKTIEIEGVNDNLIKLDVRELTEKINSVNTYAVLMYHTHPHGSIEPSTADLNATQTILYICTLLNIVFCDHIIFNEVFHLSLACAGYLDEMFNNVKQAFPTVSNKSIRFQQMPNFEYNETANCKPAKENVVIAKNSANKTKVNNIAKKK